MCRPENLIFHTVSVNRPFRRRHSCAILLKKLQEKPMRRFAALLLLIACPLWAQNTNQLPPCPKPDMSKKSDLGWKGRTWHWNDCRGRYVIELDKELRGTVVEGEWQFGQLNGQGMYAIPDGNTYKGSFRNFQPHGQGELTMRNGDRYIGEFNGGLFDGQGTYTFTSGDRYVGEFKGGKRHGVGTYTHANGERYVGEYRDDRMHGQGSYHFPNGDLYVGEFRNSNFHGAGILTTHDGQRQEGLWENDKLVTETEIDTTDAEAEQEIERERRELAEERRRLEEERRLFEQERENADTLPPPRKDDDKRIVAGSGFIITSDGYVVTNYHVIENATELTVRTTNGKTYQARVAKLDSAHDLAVLKIPAAGLPYIPIADSSGVKKGTSVLTGGFPQILVQGIEPKITDGIISSLAGIRDDASLFQISNPIQPGNSGGPLFTLDGNVIGIVSAKLSDRTMLKEFNSIPQNVNFAVKSSHLLELLKGMRAVRLPPPNPKRKFHTTEDVVGAVEPALVLVIGE